MKRMKYLILFLSAVFLFSSIMVPTVSAKEQAQNIPEEIVNEEDFEPVNKVLSAIEKLPEDVYAQGEQATVEWLSQETGYEVYVDDNGMVQFEDNRMKVQFNLAACIGAVGVAVVSNGLPFTKLLKVKKALKALGGTTKAIKKIKKSYDEYRYNGFSRKKSLKKAVNDASSTLGKDLKGALLDFFNISAVIGSCT